MLTNDFELCLNKVFFCTSLFTLFFFRCGFLMLNCISI
jgi:hypothetical protein